MPFEGCSALKDEVSLVTYDISCCLFFNKHKLFRKARISRYGIIVDQVLKRSNGPAGKKKMNLLNSH